MVAEEVNLRKSAGMALIWGVAFNFGRDIIQFGSMIILVRLLSPEIYGQFALAQSIQLFLGVVSFKTIAPFAFQARDPSKFDWDTHFSAGLTLNLFITAVTLCLAAGFYTLGGQNLRAAGVVLALMAFVFPIEVMSTHYFSWLQAQHTWARMRILLLLGAVGSASISVLLAATGAGVVALAVGNGIFVLPLVADYFIRRPYPLRFQRDWYSRYSEGRAFALNRMTATSLQTGSTVVENSIFSGIFGFSTLGIYTRSIGLAHIASGRIGPLVAQTLYPVLTRADASSDRYRRFAGILFQGVLWTSVPAAAFLGVEADHLVRFLYGEKWLGVIPLLGAAAVLLALRGLHQTMNQIMLANLQYKVCLRLEWAGAVSMLAAILSAAFLEPKGYLLVLGAHAALVLFGTAFFAVRGGAITASHTVRVMASCIVATTVAIAVVMILPGIELGPPLLSTVLSLTAHGVAFVGVYTMTLRLIAPKDLAVLLGALPLPTRLKRAASLFVNVRRRPSSTPVWCYGIGRRATRKLNVRRGPRQGIKP